MAKTNLREYNKYIETLIDQNSINEAIAHCKYILKLFPKHVDTYRLLGKAYLESRRFSDAADLFLRVLSVIPDDFIAHIGMSIIREDEKNLDASIWHMERAFEVQPSNSAIQEELRRLYGRRDGAAPQKVRLTRGALIRMYARGELYPQAVAEAKVALSEEPDRIELAVLLAKMHSICNQKAEAADICNRILSKLPYCYEANQTLFDLLPENAQEERKIYQQRLFAINPYVAYLTSSYPSVTLVPDQSIMLERLEYNGETTVEEQPEWAQSVGAELSSIEEQASDWLPNNADQFIRTPDNSQTTELPTDHFQSDTSPVITATRPVDDSPIIPQQDKEEDNLIPDWMQSEGWIKSDRSADDVMVSQHEPEPDVALPAEIPTWLQEIAPEDATSSNNTQAEPRPAIDPSDEFSWLHDTSDTANEDKGDPPAWLIEEQAALTSRVPLADGTIQSGITPPPDLAPVSAEMDLMGANLEAGMAWLEQLAQKQRMEQESAPVESQTAVSSSPVAPDQLEAPTDAGQSSREANSEVEPIPEWLRESSVTPLPDVQAKAEDTSQPIETGSIESENESIYDESKPNEPAPGASTQSAEQEAFKLDEIPSWMLPDKAQHGNAELLPQSKIKEPEPDLEALSNSLQPGTEITAADSNNPEIEMDIPEWITSQSVIENISPIPPEENGVVSGSLLQTDTSGAFLDSDKIAATENNESQTTNLLPSAPSSETDEAVVPDQELFYNSESTSPTANELDSITTETAAPESKTMDLLEQSRLAADANDIPGALTLLSNLIQNNISLIDVTARLVEMTYRHPVDPSIWQTLGDAYFKSNQLQAAIDAYTKAEELIR